VSSLLPRGLDATIVLLRHGESAWIAEGRFQGQGDPALSPLGWQQAGLAADRLAHPGRPPALPIPSGPPIAILTSPLSRTSDTAHAVAGAMSDRTSFGVTLRPEPDPGFLEIGQGEWEGLPAATIVERWGAILEGWRRDPLRVMRGESPPQVDARVPPARLAGASRAARPPLRRPPPPAWSQSRLPRRAVDEPGPIGPRRCSRSRCSPDLPLRASDVPFAIAGISVVAPAAARLRVHNAADHLAPLEEATPAAGEAVEARDEARSQTGAL
jgi:broad specificity phosphatase PhoE